MENHSLDGSAFKNDSMVGQVTRTPMSREIGHLATAGGTEDPSLLKRARLPSNQGNIDAVGAKPAASGATILFDQKILEVTMDFTLKFAAYDDLEAADRVEKSASRGVYLADAWHYFSSLKGELVCAYDGDRMIGIGRFTVLPDGTGWLETLRVSPDHQRQGVGKLIYKKWTELAKEYGCPSMAMFTGVTNAASSGLAELYGLKTVAQHRGCHLTGFVGGNPHGFKHVYWQRAVQLILPHKDEYNNYMTFNRTFYHINEANAKAFAIEGKVFEDEGSGSFIVCGGRFQQNAALHIAMMGGDVDKCLDFAINYARAQGIEKISCTFALENEKLERALYRRGFIADKVNLITKEVVFGGCSSKTV